jgi:nucleotide-binding universal stress UspA family protein
MDAKMMKSFLVCTDGSDASRAAEECGIRLASRLEAHLTGLHVLDIRLLEGPLLADVSGWIGAQPYSAQLGNFNALLRERGEAVLEAFSKLCEQHGVRAETLFRTGHPVKTILEEERHTECLVLGRKGEHAGFVDLLGSTAETVSRHCEKPCLVVGETFRPIEKIMAAFDGSAHAGDAMVHAAELARELKAELVAVTAGNGEEEDPLDHRAREAQRIAERHGAAAVPLVKAGPAREAVLEAAREQACDLLVVGAYGHSRIRERILGSMPTWLIAHAPMSVLIVR